MGPVGITVALAMFWLTGVVGAASLPPDDQYSPQQSPYRRDVAQGPRGYPTWLKHQKDPATKLEPPDNTPDARRLDDNDFSWERISRKDSVIRNSDLAPLAPGGWKVAADVVRNSSKSAGLNLGVLEDGGISSASVEDGFVEGDSFQDQGPGSVEVYKLDLHRENSLLVPHANEKQPVVGTRTKSKIPKKATAKEILWKLKSIDSSKSSLPATFQQPLHSRRESTLPRQSRRKIKENRKDEVFAVGGVPELQVGCEGLEASERDKRSSGPGVENINEKDWENSHKYQDPVYRESTEPILLRVTPIVLDLEEEEPPSGEIYEEMDELLKLKKLESTSPKPTTKRWNRADIDPALAIDKHHDEHTRIETFPERGDLGPSNGSSSEVKGSIADKESTDHRLEKLRFGRSIERESLNHQGGRRLLWVQYPERQEYANQGTKTRHHQDANHHSDLWGFGEEDGDLSDSEADAELDKLREAEAEKRRREYERRRQEELDRRRGGHGHRPHEDHPPRSGDANSEIERIRQEYERQLEKEQRERQRIEEERRRQEDRRRGGEDHQRRVEDPRRQQEEKEQRRNHDPWNSRRREEENRRNEWNRRREEEAERLRRLENQRTHQDPPSSLTRPQPSHYPGNISGSRQEKEAEERKLREYIERNRPIDPKKTGERRRPDEQSRRNENDERRRHMDEQRRRQMDEERRRQQMEEHRRRQQQPDEDERRKQMEEHRRRQQQSDENERRKQMEEQRRRDRPESRAMEEERRHRLEEERKLQEYVRRNQPVNVPRRNNSEASILSQGSRDLEEQRRTIEAARQWERNRQPIAKTNDARIHGPSAPTSIGQRYSQYDFEEMRRRQERLEQERRRESDWQRLAEEERRREAEIRRTESWRHEEERKRLEAAVRRDEEDRRAQSEGRRNSWQDSVSSRRPGTGSRRYDPTDEVRDREAEELRRQEAADRTSGNTMRNRDDELRRRSEERDRERKQQEERERQRFENERNSRNNERRRPQHENSGSKPRQRGDSFRGGHDDMEWTRREHARLSSLPVRATIVLRSDDASKNIGGRSPSMTLPTPLDPSIPSFGSRANFDNEIDFPAMNPNRPGLAAPGFPAPPTARPPVKSPGACVWAIVQCCPANNRLTSCFESMGCPGANWDSSPCRGSLADAARAEVVRFYEAADETNTRF